MQARLQERLLIWLVFIVILLSGSFIKCAARLPPNSKIGQRNFVGKSKLTKAILAAFAKESGGVALLEK